MKRFRFSLHAVRELRAADERFAQLAYAAAVRACAAAAARLASVGRDLQAVWDGIRDRAAQGMPAEEMRRAHAWCRLLEENQKQLGNQLALCQRQVEAAHQALLASTRRREALDRMFRKQYREHEHAARAADQKFLDEIATRGAWHGAAELETA